MPLISCPECGNQVSDKAKNCPICGYPINPDDSKNKKDMVKPFINIIKAVIAILLFICLLDMPYGYYQLIRFITMVVFILLALNSYRNSRFNEAILLIAIAILFQPIFKISLGRIIWNIIDIIVGVYLIFSIFIRSKNES